MRVVANLGFLFQEVPLLKRYALAAAAGFRMVECPDPYTESAEDLRKEADKHSLSHTLINAPAGGVKGLAAIQNMEEFAPSISKAIQYCKALDCTRLHVMAGIACQEDISRRRYFQNISLACELCQDQGIQVFIEPICRAAIPGYFLNDLSLVMELVAKELKVAVLLDLYHLQQIQGDLTHTVKYLEDNVKYIQVAQVPHRHEPHTSGEINYEYVFRMLRENGHENTLVGCEYNPATDDFSWIRKFNLTF